MSNLSIPNAVANGAAADGNQVGANFNAIQDWADDHVVEQDSVQLVPVGTVLPYAGSSAPSGYLLADGTAVERATYADLFALIGTTYGAGNGTTTFNLPNLKARFPVGRDATVGAHDALGETGGSRDAVVVSHSHTGPSHTHSTPAHTHTGSAATSGSHTHGSASGSYPYVAILRTDASVGIKYESGFVQDLHNAGLAAGGDHTHTVTVDSGGASTTGAGGTGATSTDGVAASNANLPPYLTLNYIVKF